jgi:hypothetical protein
MEASKRHDNCKKQAIGSQDFQDLRCATGLGTQPSNKPNSDP